MALSVAVVSPERILFEDEADMVIARSEGGDIAFLSGHAPFVGSLGIGRVRIQQRAGEIVVAVHGGFVEVKDDRVTILSDVAEMPEDIDVERARAARQRAEDQLRSEADSRHEAALRRAELRLSIAGAD